MLKQVYEELIAGFGEQGWWPVAQNNEIEPVYGKKNKNVKNLSEKQKLEIVFGAILAQNTNWNNAKKAIIELNKNCLIDAEKIVGIDSGELGKIIRSAGFFSQKAQRLKTISKFVEKNSLKKLEEMNDALLREKLLSLNGIGEETADSILLYAFGKPFFVIDAYTKRIFSRLLGLNEKISYGELQELFHKELKKNAGLFNEFHALLVRLGKENCAKAKPRCENCMVKLHCGYYENEKKFLKT